MSKFDLKEAIVNALANNTEAMTANDLVIALADEASATSVNRYLKTPIAEGQVERFEGAPVTFQLMTPAGEEMASDVEELMAGAPSELALPNAPMLSEELIAELAALRQPKPVAYNAAVKFAVLEELIKYHGEHVGSVLHDISEDLLQIAAQEPAAA